MTAECDPGLACTRLTLQPCGPGPRAPVSRPTAGLLGATQVSPPMPAAGRSWGPPGAVAQPHAVPSSCLWAAEPSKGLERGASVCRVPPPTLRARPPPPTWRPPGPSWPRPRAGGTEGVGRGHHRHQISFHLCKDSLTPEHINILNDSERSRTADARPPTLPSPLPGLFLLPPHPVSSLLLSHTGPSLSLSVSLCPAVFPVFLLSLLWGPASPPLPFRPPLLSLLPLQGPHSSPASTNSHPEARGGPSWASPSVRPSPAGPPPPSQEAGEGRQGRAVGPRERLLNPATTAPGGAHTPRLVPLAQRHTRVCLPLPGTRAGKLKRQVWVWGATGEGRVLGRIFCFVFFMTIYNFAFLPSAPASLAPRCVPH